VLAPFPLFLSFLSFPSFPSLKNREKSRKVEKHRRKRLGRCCRDWECTCDGWAGVRRRAACRRCCGKGRCLHPPKCCWALAFAAAAGAGLAVEFQRVHTPLLRVPEIRFDVQVPFLFLFLSFLSFPLKNREKSFKNPFLFLSSKKSRKLL